MTTLQKPEITGPLTESDLVKACAHFKQLIDDPNTLTQNAHKLVRATYLPIADVQAAIDHSTNGYVKVYYGVLESKDGDHFIFMAPGNQSVAARAEPRRVGLLMDAQTVTNQRADKAGIAVPECIGKIPPCPEIKDQFVQ